MRIVLLRTLSHRIAHLARQSVCWRSAAPPPLPNPLPLLGTVRDGCGRRASMVGSGLGVAGASGPFLGWLIWLVSWSGLKLAPTVYWATHSAPASHPYSLLLHCCVCVHARPMRVQWACTVADASKLNPPRFIPLRDIHLVTHISEQTCLKTEHHACPLDPD